MESIKAERNSEPERNRVSGPLPDYNEKHHFLTVDWCGEGKRGLFVQIKRDVEHTNILPFHKLDPYTKKEMKEILGTFELILKPKSVEMSFNEAFEHKELKMLAEYSNAYGIIIKPKPVVS